MPRASSSADLAAIRAMPGVVEVVRDGSFLGVVARREEQAQAAANAARQVGQVGRRRAAVRRQERLRLPADGRAPRRAVLHTVKADASPAAVTHQAEYRRHFQAHASIGASCALAQWQDGQADGVVAHAGAVPLRGDLAKALKVAPDTIRVIHAQGAGCYGHNGADDVALDAALLARAVPGKPVRVHWAHEEEMAWEPWGSAMVTRLDAAALSADGALTQWTHDVWSFPHLDAAGQRRGLQLCARPGISPIPCCRRRRWTARCRTAPPRATRCRSTRRPTRR